MERSKEDFEAIYERNRRIWYGLDNPEEIQEEKVHKEVLENIFKGIPFLPQNLGCPKNVIPYYYEKHHRDVSFSANDCFFSWNDGAKAHAMYHTAVFKCPVSGELFGCGQFGDKSLYQVRKDSLNEPKCDDNGIGDDVNYEEPTVIWYRKCFHTNRYIHLFFTCLLK